MEKSSIQRWDWPSALLILFLIQVATARLVVTNWTPFLYFTQTLGTLAGTLGLGLGASRFGRHVVRRLATIYTIVLIPWQLTAAIDVDLPFAERLSSVGGRLLISLGQFFQRQPVDDTLFFVAFVSFGFWVIGLTAGYWLARYQNFLVAVLPAGIVMLIIQSYDNFVPTRLWSLAIYAFAALLLLGRLYFLQNRTTWKVHRVFLGPEAAQDLSNSLLAATIMVVLVAWIFPTSLSSLESAARAWDKFTRPIRERFSNAVSALDSPYGGGKGDFYTGQLTLGRSAVLGDGPVFTVKVTAPQDAAPRYYWRGRVYDHYANGQWTNATAFSQDFSPNSDELIIPDAASRTKVRFTFTSLFPKQGLLYAPSQPVWTSRRGNVLLTTAGAQERDPLAWMADPGLSSGDRYQIRAAIANPTIEDLQFAGTDYPDWLTGRYLQVPQDIAPRIQVLARQITAGLTTPYEKAAAVTAYLRGEIEYESTIAPSPKDVDPLIWFLFDYRKGFCNYYASAEVLMLRSLGIPARLAVGFAQGELDESANTYTVLKKDAHAWPEVYFPSTGWVEFEPTGNQDPLVRPEGPHPVSAPQSGQPTTSLTITPQAQADLTRTEQLVGGGETPPLPFAETPLGRALSTGLLLIVAALLLVLNQRYGLFARIPLYLAAKYERGGRQPPGWIADWARWMRLTSIEKSFEVVNLSLRWLGQPQPIHATAAQRATILTRMLPSATAAIEALTAEHQTTLFTPQPGDASRARHASLTILLHMLPALLKRALEAFGNCTPLIR